MKTITKVYKLKKSFFLVLFSEAGKTLLLVMIDKKSYDFLRENGATDLREDQANIVGLNILS